MMDLKQLKLFIFEKQMNVKQAQKELKDLKAQLKFEIALEKQVKADAKVAKKAAKIKAMEAKLEALRNPTPLMARKLARKPSKVVNIPVQQAA